MASEQMETVTPDDLRGLARISEVTLDDETVSELASQLDDLIAAANNLNRLMAANREITLITQFVHPVVAKHPTE
jgi:Asp-tRNA(Asn)/Glu-tRNA(Gln) amidotransferase C subunit